ncbi:magnesium or manganese-dependent protein phosphatase [Streptomyces cinereoruber]|uniref:protein-serine/threonine phosphatase n=1 Tax=Streptomyces cinereoruber TaxID=67260 RepID=A0AAV4KTI4_9ACTN|nr:serine phosphatase RsbU (regulator of sigma subunit)/anti-sigma regulatory factor (Ser/Thr protein kinase) [Streptomyces cinereoruber]MBY8819301.1 SpoIIE family protein phosphatase [Streptomyces cinereoruber]NIH61683.1 serine phosphatase RsbU (regulator of sigma subunit)/anti-sigma regulatory factor (Ser/Thr protein kinase) [Streptomyces cinereoruber]QEV35964.1 protein phosphatase [Streptomyces cinereoruber]GGR49877.1 magnesium or manganese-dependent protein phosphatase [Streptomyces cinereo
MSAGNGGGEANGPVRRAQGGPRSESPGGPPDGAPILSEYGSAFRMGGFDWDLLTGTMQMDDAALAVFDLDREEYDGRPESLGSRVLPDESSRLDALVAQALKDGSDQYGAYFRIRRRDGRHQWTHTQGIVHRDATGRPVRIIGVLRDATHELTESAARLGLDEGRRKRAGVVEGTTAALAHARTVKDVIDLLNDSHALEHFGAASLVMGLLEAGRIHLVAEGPEGAFVPGTRFTRVDEPYPMSEVIRTLRPRFIDSPRDFSDSYPVLWPHISGLGVTAAAYLPLIAQARPIGALGLLYSDRTGFSEDERTLLVALSSSIAQSLQRAMLYEQEHDLAEGLQQAMLPRRIPEVPGARTAVRYRSARLGRDIGGDWYDVIALPGGRVGAVIGDVQGHDTHAAAVMGQLRIVLRAYAAEGHTPATVMARASVFLHELDTERFATCTYAEVDLRTGVVQLVRAGHVDPLIRESDGRCRRLPVEGGLPLGLSAEFGRLDYPVTTLELDPGQTLLLYTDGLVEKPGADLDEGLQWLSSLVRRGPDDLQELADHLCDVVAERGGEDDVAILLLRRHGTYAAPGAGRFQQHVAQSDPEALRSARHMIRAAVRAWGAGERADEIELVADELMTNALMHTDGGAIVTLRVLPGPTRRLRVEVEDRSSALPRRREAGEAGVSGRGLLLVDQLSDAWGVESRGGGKCVWCEFVVESVVPET